MQKARMTANLGGKELVGTVVYTGGDSRIKHDAELKLTKIESDAPPIIDISGTYTAEITHRDLGPYTPADVYFGKKPNIKINIEQTGKHCYRHNIGGSVR